MEEETKPTLNDGQEANDSPVTPESEERNEESDQSEVSAPQESAPKTDDDSYQESDVFAWANNLVQYKDELKIELFFISKNYTLYKTATSESLAKQLEPIFIDEILEYVLEGAEVGLIVRSFEEAEAEHKVLQRTRVKNVAKLQDTLTWLRTQYAEIPIFSDEEHDFKRVKGVMARVSHDGLERPFYIFKVLPGSSVMKGKTGWMLKSGKFVPFDADAAVRIPTDPQLLLIDEDLYVFNQAKLKQLFGYDVKEAAIARAKVAEIEANFSLVFEDGITLNSLVEGKKSLIKKLQKIDPSLVKQDELMSHAEEMGIDLMQDDSGAIIIMDDKDLSKFVNLLNDDYVESPMTGLRYEIVNKKALKVIESDSAELI